ncbi:MAG: hypothetical protein ACI8YI_002353, partial [Paracoccaceae bacterium]
MAIFRYKFRPLSLIDTPSRPAVLRLYSYCYTLAYSLRQIINDSSNKT